MPACNCRLVYIIFIGFQSFEGFRAMLCVQFVCFCIGSDHNTSLVVNIKTYNSNKATQNSCASRILMRALALYEFRCMHLDATVQILRLVENSVGAFWKIGVVNDDKTFASATNTPISLRRQLMTRITRNLQITSSIRLK